MDNLEDLGIKAYQKHVWGDYEGALAIYNVAIQKYPRDSRLLNNRCCCYMELKEFESAMEDAENMIRLFPLNSKSYYRKGEILFYLKRYIEAEEAFRKVLTMQPDCEDARQQLLEAQVMQLCKSGYDKNQALKALRLTLSDTSPIANVEDARNILKFGAINYKAEDSETDYVYYSDDEDSSKNVITTHEKVNDPLMDPSNPLKSNSLWVGNITEQVTEKKMKEMFSKYGKILSIYVYHFNYCAFINYTDHVAPGKAMKALQGASLDGKKILIKFPDSATQSHKRTKAL
ncbi:hypothetical protein C0J52_03153 [Blattella germanica]|nr:hypothetical protein C0J52_03153 [Blattella germanica]